MDIDCNMEKLFLAIMLGMISSGSSDNCFIPTRINSTWRRVCQPNETISRIASRFSASHGDRSWMICCRQISEAPSFGSDITCTAFSAPRLISDVLVYNCPEESYVNGIINTYTSERSKKNNFQFRCCRKSRTTLYNRSTGGWRNDYTRTLRYTVQQGDVLVGVESVFSREEMDSRFKFSTEEMQ